MAESFIVTLKTELVHRGRFPDREVARSAIFEYLEAFTNRPFSGNPAGVLVLEKPRQERWMQAVAAELSLSETCFLHPLPQKRWSLRWFTPIHEVALCGHATLAASHLLWEEGYLAEIDQACFETRSGQVVASRRGEEIELDFPIVPVAAAQEPLRLERILGGVAYRFVGQTQHETERETNYLVELQNEGDVRALEVDLKALASLPAGGLIITARSEDRNFDFVSRYFAPIFGIPEDPVTGSAHCTLGPFWRDLLGKDELRALQVSRRVGELNVRVAGRRIYLGGRAITVIRGYLSREASV